MKKLILVFTAILTITACSQPKDIYFNPKPYLKSQSAVENLPIFSTALSFP